MFYKLHPSCQILSNLALCALVSVVPGVVGGFRAGKIVLWGLCVFWSWLYDVIWDSSDWNRLGHTQATLASRSLLGAQVWCSPGLPRLYSLMSCVVQFCLGFRFKRCTVITTSRKNLRSPSSPPSSNNLPKWPKWPKGTKWLKTNLDPKFFGPKTIVFPEKFG